MKNILIATAFLSIMLTSCAKETDYLGDNNNGLADTKWVATALLVTAQVGGQTQEFDLWAINDACAKDNITIFNANGTVTLDEGASKCDASDPQTEDDGTWKLSEDKKKLTISSAGENYVADVLQFENTTLKFKYSETFNGETASFTATLKKVN